jgi:hypothetical protein
MAEKKVSESNVRRDFAEFLETCPTSEERETAATVGAIGIVMRSERSDGFLLRTADNVVHEVPTDAVEEFSIVASAAGERRAQLRLNAERLGADLAARLGGNSGVGAIKSPFETLKEPPYETLKEAPSDTLKEAPFETLKEPPSDTLKEIAKDVIGDGGSTGIADTLVEGIPGIPGGGLMNPQFAAGDLSTRIGSATPQTARAAQFTDQLTLKEVVHDTLKEQPFDTLKEVVADTWKEAIADTWKETVADTLKESAADTLVENIPGLPEAGIAQQRAVAAAQPAALSAGMQLTGLQHKAAIADQPGLTIKEIIMDPMTLKEIIADQWTYKELVKDPITDPLQGTGIADSLAEGTFPGGGLTTQPGLAGAAAMTPFVLATPHQAPQGALAQQYLAAMAARGGLGLL